jgi:hypothetical protein
MRTLRYISGWLLLVTLVAGGILGPSIHRFQHTQTWEDTQPRAPASVSHTDVPLWSEAGDHVEAPECELCATRLLVVPPSLEPVVVPQRERSVAQALRSHLIVAAVVAVPFIRGPPRQA